MVSVSLDPITLQEEILALPRSSFFTPAFYPSLGNSKHIFSINKTQRFGQFDFHIFSTEKPHLSTMHMWKKAGLGVCRTMRTYKPQVHFSSSLHDELKSIPGHQFRWHEATWRKTPIVPG